MHGYIGEIPQGAQCGEQVVIIVDSRELRTAKFFLTAHGSTTPLLRLRPDTWSFDRETGRETASFDRTARFDRFTSFSYSPVGLPGALVIMTVDYHGVLLAVQQLDDVGAASMLYLLMMAARDV